MEVLMPKTLLSVNASGNISMPGSFKTWRPQTVGAYPLVRNVESARGDAQNRPSSSALCTTGSRSYPSTARTSITLPISAVGLPCSSSRRNRSDTSASSATSSWVSLRSLRWARTKLPSASMSTLHLSLPCAYQLRNVRTESVPIGRDASAILCISVRSIRIGGTLYRFRDVSHQIGASVPPMASSQGGRGRTRKAIRLSTHQRLPTTNSWCAPSCPQCGVRKGVFKRLPCARVEISSTRAAVRLPAGAGDRPTMQTLRPLEPQAVPGQLR